MCHRTKWGLVALGAVCVGLFMTPPAAAGVIDKVLVIEGQYLQIDPLTTDPDFGTAEFFFRMGSTTSEKFPGIMMNNLQFMLDLSTTGKIFVFDLDGAGAKLDVIGFATFDITGTAQYQSTKDTVTVLAPLALASQMTSAFDLSALNNALLIYDISPATINLVDTGLSASESSSLQPAVFYNSTAANPVTATFRIVPIPEPSSWLLAVLGLAVLLWAVGVRLRTPTAERV